MKGSDLIKDPCTMCVNYSETVQGFRKFIGCNDEEKRKGFHYDNFLYHHTCDNQNIREECKDCEHNKGTYCNSVTAFVDGKCVDRVKK